MVEKIKNMYLLVSEALESGGDFYEPPETYYLVGLVVATSPSQAKYLLALTDNNVESNPVDFPKFKCNLRYKDCKLDIGVIGDSHTRKYDNYWYDGRYCGQEGRPELEGE